MKPQHRLALGARPGDRHGRVRVQRFLCALWVVGLTACMPADPPEPKPEPLDPKGSTGVSMRGYNYTAEGVQVFYVNGGWASNVLDGGGGDVCCVMLPNQWHDGLTVQVDWTMGHYTLPWEQRKQLSVAEERRCCWSERTLSQTVPVQRYDRPNTLQVFFLPDDKLEVWVSRYDLGHPDHPSKRGYPIRPVVPMQPVPEQKP